MPITFPDPGVLQYNGIHRAIADAGYALAQVNGVWTADNEAAVQAIINGYPVESTKSEVIALIDNHARALRDQVVSNISPAEMAAWSIKRDEAAAYAVSGNAADAPMLSAEATARGITLGALVQRVESNAAMFTAIEAAIAGVSGKHRDAISACVDHASIALYDWRTGWPV